MVRREPLRSRLAASRGGPRIARGLVNAAPLVKGLRPVKAGGATIAAAAPERVVALSRSRPDVRALAAA